MTDDRTAISRKDVMATTKLDPTLQAWIAAHRRHRLAHAHGPMAHELERSLAMIGVLDDVPRPAMPRDDSEATR